jgi:putative hemolysin
LLILSNGVFALSEIAVVSSRKVRLQHRAEEGKRQAQIALKLANNPNDFLSTVQVGITFIGTLAGAFGGATLAERMAVYLNTIALIAPHGEAVAISIVVLGISYCSLIIGELVPKRLALSNPERFAMLMAGPMHLLSRIGAPAVRVLSWSTDVVLKLIPMKRVNEPAVTEEEIKLMIEQGTKTGTFEVAEQDMIKGVFQLGDRRAVELMQPRMTVVWLDIQSQPETIQATIRAHRYSRFPVGKGSLDRLLGYVHVKDLLELCMVGSPLQIDRCIRPLPAISENMPALKILEIFQRDRTNIAMVVDEHGAFEGLVTMHDIVEAIIGDLPAPGDRPEERATQREDGSWLIDGTLPIFEFKALAGIDKLVGEDEHKFTTIGGFVLAQLRRIPIAGDHFIAAGWRYEVVDMDRNRVDKLLVNKIPDSKTASDNE